MSKPDQLERGKGLENRPKITAHSKGGLRLLFGTAASVLAACVTSPTSEVPATPAPVSVQTSGRFLYNECIDIGTSWSVYEDEEGFRVGERQVDTGCDHFWQVTITDSGKFPQCLDVKQTDRSVLFEDPLDFKDSFAPINPQLRHAINTIYANGLHDIVDIKLLPQQTIVQLEATPGGPYCLPELSSSSSYRVLVQVSGGPDGSGSGYGWPVGWPDRKVFVELPEGLNPIKVTRMSSCFPGSCGDPTRKEVDFMFLNLAPDQEFTIGNLDRSWVTTGKGPLALPLKWVVNNRESVIGRLILPDSGFAEDKPLKLLPNQFID